MEPDDPPRKKYELKPRQFEQLNPPGPAGKAPEHDVHAMLQQNRAVEQQTGMDEFEIREKKSRRKSDYWLLLIVGNALISGLVAFIGFNFVTLVCGLSAIVLFCVGLTWIMWVVMSDY